MTDLSTETTTEPTGAPTTNIMAVPVTKGSGSVDVDLSTLPDDVYREALLQGLKVLVNRGMSKITKEALPDEATRKSEAMLKAQKNVDDLKAGKVKITG